MAGLLMALMVPDCARQSALVGRLLRLGLELDWSRMHLPHLVLLAGVLMQRLTEAAAAGFFSSRDSSLSKLAAKLAHRVLTASGE